MTYPGGDLRGQLAYTGRAAVAAGLVIGSGGNLSARASDADACWVTATGVWLDRLDHSSFTQVRISDGAALAGATPVVSGSRLGVGPASGTQPDLTEPGDVRPDEPSAPATPTSELELHLATYRARPDVLAVVHLHPQTVLLLDALDEPIRLVTTDHVSYLQRIVRTRFAPPGTPEVARLAAEAAMDGTNCVILGNHGCVVLADSVELATKRALYLEEAARLTHAAVLLGAAGRLRLCPPTWSPAATTV